MSTAKRTSVACRQWIWVDAGVAFAASPRLCKARESMTESDRSASSRRDSDRRPGPTASTGTGQPALAEKSTSGQPGRGPGDSGPLPTTRGSFASPPSHVDTEPGRYGAPGQIGATTAGGTGDPAQLLFTPAQAAAALQVRESWLRRRAARRDVPCTFLGKHLRFSRADLDAIVAQAAHCVPVSPGGTRRRSPRGVPSTPLGRLNR